MTDSSQARVFLSKYEETMRSEVQQSEPPSLTQAFKKETPTKELLDKFIAESKEFMAAMRSP